MFLWQLLTALLLITVRICEAQECEKFTKLNVGHAVIGTTLKIRLLLYTRENGICASLLSHNSMSDNPQLNVSRPTAFVIHGFRPTGSQPVWLKDMTEELLARSDMNVIVVDWNRGAATSYFKAVENTKKAGANLTSFIEMMQEHGASLSSIHMIGFSLGAHISGYVGGSLNGSIGRISALDPAGLMFTGSPPQDRLDSTDAQFVDVLHTDSDALGYREPLGHIDFYANGGKDQPGCPKTIFSGEAYFKCDHQRSVALYIDSLTQSCPSRAYPCSSYKDFQDGKCFKCDQFGAAGCPVFGYDVIQWKDTLLELKQTQTYFTTNPKSPYCMSNYRMDVMIWNKDVHWGYITVKLHNNGTEAVATIDHAASEFKKFTETTLLAQFDKVIQRVEKVSLKFFTGNVLKPKQKLRVLRLRLTHLEHEQRPLCRYDLLLEENKEVFFRPIPCDASNF